MCRSKPNNRMPRQGSRRSHSPSDRREEAGRNPPETRFSRIISAHHREGVISHGSSSPPVSFGLANRSHSLRVTEPPERVCPPAARSGVVLNTASGDNECRQRIGLRSLVFAPSAYRSSQCQQPENNGTRRQCRFLPSLAPCAHFAAADADIAGSRCHRLLGEEVTPR